MADFDYLDWASKDAPAPSGDTLQPREAPTWTDYGKSALMGATQLQSAAQSAISYLHRDDPETAQLWNEIAQNSRQNGGDLQKGMSPSARKEIDAAITSDTFWDHPFSTAALQTAQMSPAMIAAILPGGIVGDALGAVAGTGVAIATGAGLGGAQFIDNVGKGIDDASDGDLRAQSKAYDQLRNVMPEADARRTLRDTVVSGNGRLALAALAGGLGGVGGIGGMVARGAGSGAGGLLARVGAGAAEAGGVGAIQGGITDAAQQAALTEAGAQTGFNKQEWLGNVITQLGIGGTLGGTLGGLHGALHPGEKIPTSKQQTGGESTASRSSRTYAKPDTAEEPPAVEPTDKGPVDAAQAAALTSESKAPEPTTSVAPTPPPAVETPVPEAPRPVATSTAPATDTAVPESPATLAAQQKELTEGKRPLMVFKGGENLLPVPPGMKQTKLGGDVFQYDPARIKYTEIRTAIKRNTLGELLGLGPVTKDDAAARVAQGETPVGIVERAPDGTELKAAAGTDQTAPAQVAVLEANKAPDSTVGVEAPAQVIAGRVAAQPEPTSKSNPALNQLMSPTEAGKGRVLADVSDEGKAAAKTNAKLTDQQIEANKEQPEAEVKGKNRTKAEIAKRVEDNHTADGIMHRFPPHAGEASAINPMAKGGIGARLIVKNRALAMLDAAKEAGLKIPESLKDNTNADMSHGPGMALLVEAKALTKKATPATSDYERFVKREYDLRAGNHVEVLSERRAEGAKELQPDLEAGGTGGKVADSTFGVTESHEDDVLDRITSEGRERPTPKIEGAAFTAGKTQTAPVTVVKKNRGQMLKDKAALVRIEASPEMSRFDKIKEYRKVFEQETGRAPNHGKERDFERYLDIKEGTASKTLESWAPEIKNDIRSQIARARAETNKAPTPAQKEAGNYSKGKLTFEGNRISIENPKGATRTGVAPSNTPRKIWEMREIRPDMAGEPIHGQINKLRSWLNSLSDSDYALLKHLEGSDVGGHASGSLEPEKWMGMAKESLAQAKKEGVQPPGKIWSVKMPGDYGYIRGTRGADGDHVDVLLGSKGETGKVFIINQKDPKTGAFDEHKVVMGVNTEAEARELYGKSFSDGSGPSRIHSIAEMSVEHLRELLDEKDHALREPVSPLPGTGEVEGSAGKFTPIETTTAGSLLSKVGDISWGGAGAKLIPFLRRKLASLVADVPVHWVSREEINRLHRLPNGKEAGGYYDTGAKHIVLPDDIRPADLTHMIMHEAIHAAVADALDKDPVIQSQVKMLMKEFDKGIRIPGKSSYRDRDYKISRYAMTNEHEFLAELMSNPELQELAARTSISEQLAGELGIKAFRAASLWSGVLHMIRKALGLPESMVSVLEAATHVTEALTWDKRPQEAIAFGARLDARNKRILPAPMQEVEREMRQPREEANQRTSALTFVGNAARSIMERTPTREGILEKGVKLMSNDQMRQMLEKHFGSLDEHNPMRKLTDAIEKMNVRMQKYLEPGNKLAKAMDQARRQFEGDRGWDSFTKLQSDATTHNLHPDQPLDSSANKHLALPKGAKTDDEAAMRVWQSRAKHADLAKDYRNLPEPLKALWGRMRDYYAAEHEARSKAVLTAMLEGHDAPPNSTVKEAVDRALNGTMTEQDTEHYDALGIGKALKGATEFQRQQGFYAPKKRFGDYVVTGAHELTVPKGATRISDDTLEFATRKEAHDYVANSDLPAKADTVYYDPTTGKVTTKEGGLSTAGNPTQKYQVTVERQHVEFADTIREAKAKREAMKEAGIGNIKDLDRRAKNPEVDYSLSSPQVQALINGVRRRTDLSDAQKNVLEKALTESSITMKSGNRLETHYLKRRDVEGASRDVVRTLNSYSRASAAFRSRADFTKDVDGSLAGMRDKLDANRADGNTFSRRVALQEMESRLFGFGSPEYTGKLAPFWQKVMAISFWKRMMSPAHLLLHMTHPGMISGPVLGARHGFGQAYRELYRSYRDMGGVIPAVYQGIKGVGNVFAKDSDATNFLEYFRNQLSKVSDSSGVLKMLQALEETGHIHPNSGMEVGHYTETATRLQAGMERVDRAFRELTSSTESINRVAEALAAYRLELRKNGGDHEGAVRYAKDTLANTQGLYSATNAAPIFRNKSLRPFLQFKQFPQMIYHLLGKNLYNAFKGDTPEIRAQAAKSFAGVVATHTAMAGLLGLPMELIKAPVMLANALSMGATPSWGDLEDKAQEGMASLLGPQMGEIVMHGISRALGPFSVDVHHRLGLDSLFTFGEPKSGKTDDVMHWFEDMLFGAPASLAADSFDAIHAAVQGDWELAFEKATPVKAVDDLLKAARLGVSGKPTPAGHPGMAPLGAPAILMQGLGFKPAAASQYDAARWASEKALQGVSKEKGSLISQWAGSTGAARVKAVQAISQWNASQPQDQRITTQALQAAGKKSQGDYVLGTKVTNKNKTLLDQYQHLYNVQ